MSGYQDFSEFYDRLMNDVDYEEQAEYLLSLFRKHSGNTPKTVIDIACGSGSLCAALAARGIDPIGVDVSASMLAKAAGKFAPDQQVLLLQQDMRELDLYGTADGAVCMLDSVNHLCCTADIERFFARLRLFVEPGGLFVFDVNTPFKHRQVLGNNAFVFEEEDFVCVWRNRYLPKSAEVAMLLDFFVEKDDGDYYRLCDEVRERAYSRRTLEKLLKQTGWEPLAVYNEYTTESAQEDAQRWVFVAKNTRTVEEAIGI
ncbi:MAG: class I SAM-dependent methyltransferase [Clostridia bacterium]|nr:class I SAM-dependent methyltransferase [Clostridia bacterium]